MSRSRSRKARVLNLADSYMSDYDDSGSDDDWRPTGAHKKKDKAKGKISHSIIDPKYKENHVRKSTSIRKASNESLQKSPGKKPRPTPKVAKIILPTARGVRRIIAPENEQEQNTSKAKPKLVRIKKINGEEHHTSKLKPPSRNEKSRLHKHHNLTDDDNDGEYNRHQPANQSQTYVNVKHNRSSNLEEYKDDRLQTAKSKHKSTPIPKNMGPTIRASRNHVALSGPVLNNSSFKFAEGGTVLDDVPAVVARPAETIDNESIVFANGSEDELDQDQKRSKPKRKKAVERKPAKPKTKITPAMEGSSTNTFSIWKKVLASTHTSVATNKRKFSNDNTDSNKRRKHMMEEECVPVPVDYTAKSPRVEQSQSIWNDSDDEDKFISIFKKPVSLKSSKTVQDLNSSFLSRFGSGDDDKLLELAPAPEASNIKLVAYKKEKNKQTGTSRIDIDPNHDQTVERSRPAPASRVNSAARSAAFVKSLPKPSVNLRRVEKETQVDPQPVPEVVSITNILDVEQRKVSSVKLKPKSHRSHRTQPQYASTSTSTGTGIAQGQDGDSHSAEQPAPVGTELRSATPSKVWIHNECQTSQIEARDQSSVTDMKTSHDRGTEMDAILGPTLVNVETNTTSVELRHQGLDPIARDTMDKFCETDPPDSQYKSSQTDAELPTTTSASTSTAARAFDVQTNSRLQVDSRYRERSPDPELRGTELHSENGAQNHNRFLINERIDEAVVYAQVDEDLPAFRRLTNADLQSDEMPFAVSETLKEVYSISPRDVPAEEWEEVYPNVRMCAFNPNSNITSTTQRQMIGYINIEGRTLRPFEESADIGPILFICLEGSVVFKSNQFSTNARGEQFLNPITVQSGESILIGRGVPHSIENRSNYLATLAYFVFNVGQ